MTILLLRESNLWGLHGEKWTEPQYYRYVRTILTSIITTFSPVKIIIVIIVMMMTTIIEVIDEKKKPSRNFYEIIQIEGFFCKNRVSPLFKHLLPLLPFCILHLLHSVSCYSHSSSVQPSTLEILLSPLIVIRN